MNKNVIADKESGLFIVNKEGTDKWFVLNKNSALVFGPDNKANCLKFAEEFET